jgi:uncharacterized phage infection (PIP) family protein YhgE
MRSPLRRCRTGLAAAAALVLLTACGGSDDQKASSSASSEPTTSASETSADAAEFCTQAAAVQQRIASTFSGSSDPASLPKVLQEAATQIRAIRPPDELTADWTSFADGIEEIAKAAQVDFKDQAAVAKFRQQVGQLQQKYGGAFTNVQNYLTDQCGFSENPTETSAPTS